jgi:bifunctional non-homologous end joining protein LigD
VIPKDIMTQAPMLATPCSTPAATCLDLQDKNQYLFDTKWDGVRCLAYVDSGNVTLRNRRGVSITARYPEIADALQRQFADRSIVLDGELVCFGDDGKPDFHRIARRDQSSRPSVINAGARTIPATFIAFDVLYVDGTDLRSQSLMSRLVQMPMLDGRLANSITTVNGEWLWDLINEQSLEGIIAKRMDSRYTGKRDAAWIKLKANKRLTALVTGWVAGEGSRDHKVGALLLSLLDEDGNAVPVGKVGTGFKAADHGPLLEVLGTGEEFLVEIEYLEATRGSQLRFPSFKGVRADCERAAASLSQIGPSWQH